jgi:hypothetical protein
MKANRTASKGEDQMTPLQVFLWIFWNALGLLLLVIVVMIVTEDILSWLAR